MYLRSYRYLRSKLKFNFNMFSSLSYEEAVQKLNSLQSNKAALDQIKSDIENGKKRTHLLEMEEYLKRSGIPLHRLDDLAIVHIAGTKGKGSTSAMCESILRHHGFKTGFYSSPHLVVVRERIRINGEIISEEKFSEYFSDIYFKLDSTKSFPGDMPKYFHFLTVMAFYTFIKENVDVVILEVGIGGIDDSTNVIRKPYVVGITALGLDHMPILGTTIEEIAKAKAGIMKPGCEAYTVRQIPNAMSVLEDAAMEKKCQLHIVPDYKLYSFSNGISPKLHIENIAYKTNASLAIQLAHAWLHRWSVNLNNCNKNTTNTINEIINGKSNERDKLISKVPVKTVEGLTNCFWPGRYQRMDVGFAELYLDGAHTGESMEICVHWFSEQTRKHKKVLIFAATGDRNLDSLLQPLSLIKFETVHFVAPVSFKDISNKNDTYSIQQHSDLVSRCHKLAQKWVAIKHATGNVKIHECIWDAFLEINKSKEINNVKRSVLITGSLYLVGGALAIFNPSLKKLL